MKKVLLLGAGLVSRPLARYLLEKGFALTVADQSLAAAERLVQGQPHGRAQAWSADDVAGLRTMLRDADLAVSLLPAALHPVVARECVARQIPMVTASYVSPAMRALDAPARAAGALLLNEIGVDPGIDHMSALRIIDRVKKDGGQVVSFRSYCGGLPAAEANTNPWGYKFSWSPKGVLAAGKNPARYLRDGRQVDVPGPDLFADTHTLDVPGLGPLEAYPNRDSMGYVDLYGLRGARTVFRGTLRYPGWCAVMKVLYNTRLFEETPQDLRGLSFRDFTARLGVVPEGEARRRLEWLGLFSDEPLPLERGSALDVMVARMVEKMSYAPGERDMLVMHHEFIVEYPARGKAEKLTSTLLDFGIPNGDSSMARTVGLPAAMAARLILEGRIPGAGVRIPTDPAVYEPILSELERMPDGIRFQERATAVSLDP